MKRIRLVGTGALLLLLGVAAPIYPKQQEPDKQQDQHKQQDRDKQQPQDVKKQQARPEKQQQEAKPAKQEQQHQQQQDKSQQEQQQKQQQQQSKSANQHQQQQAKGQQEQQRQQEQQKQQQAKGQQQQRQQQANRPSQQHAHPAEQQAAWQGHRAQNWKSEHRDWQQRGGYHGYRIPDDRYRAHFGRDHWFRIYSYPVIVVGGYPRFQYGGFWFSVVDPWPQYWSDDWYDNDDVYVDYSDGGYYLYNRSYPGDRIAVEVYLN